MSQIPNQAHRRQTNGLLTGTRQFTRDASRLSIHTSAGAITMNHLISATRREYQKMGKIVSEVEFNDS
ncbi:MAG: hypothetical protein V7K47_30695 [Nostoc sp.]